MLFRSGEIGYITFKRTYARRLKEDDPNSKTEEFEDVIKREIDASDKQLKVGFTEEEKERYFELRKQLKFSTAGRFMWQLGTKTVDKLGLPSLSRGTPWALWSNHCAFPREAASAKTTNLIT